MVGDQIAVSLSRRANKSVAGGSALPPVACPGAGRSRSSRAFCAAAWPTRPKRPRRVALAAAWLAIACAPPPSPDDMAPDRVAELRAQARDAEERGDVATAIATLQQAVQVAPRDVDAWIELGRALDASEDRQGAIRCYESAIRADPDRYEPHLNLAIALMQQGITGRAQSELDEAVNASPANPLVHWNYGAALAQVGKFAPARMHLEQALRLDPGFGPAAAELGRIEALAGESGPALEHMRRADSLGVATPTFRANFGAALLQSGRPAEAALQLRQAIATDSTRAGVWNHLGVAELRNGRPEEAERAFSSARRLGPGDEDVRFNLASLYVQQQRWEAGIAVLEQPRPQRADLLALLGLALRGAGRKEAALQCMAEAAAGAPRDPNILNNYGVLLAETGDTARALEVWRQVLGLDPANRVARENLAARGQNPDEPARKE